MGGNRWLTLKIFLFAPLYIFLLEVRQGVEIVAPERTLTACGGLRDTLAWELQLHGGEP
jgi:hypothetical protein